MVCRGTVEASLESDPTAFKRMNLLSLIPACELPENKPSALKRDPWLSPRFFLQDVDDSIIEKAERREDTWEFLVRLPHLTGNSRDFIQAGLSYSKAICKLIGIDLGWTTPWFDSRHSSLIRCCRHLGTQYRLKVVTNQGSEKAFSSFIQGFFLPLSISKTYPGRSAKAKSYQ